MVDIIEGVEFKNGLKAVEEIDRSSLINLPSTTELTISQARGLSPPKMLVCCVQTC